MAQFEIRLRSAFTICTRSIRPDRETRGAGRGTCESIADNSQCGALLDDGTSGEVETGADREPAEFDHYLRDNLSNNLIDGLAESRDETT
jgi:hypothetical protein